MNLTRFRGYQEAMARLNPANVRAAAGAALDDAVAFTHKALGDEIRRVYNISVADLSPRLSRQQVNMQSLTAEISISGRSFSLAYFGARQIAVNRVITRQGKSLQSRQTTRASAFRGVVVEVKKGKTTQLKSAFLARMPSGHIGVMERKGKKRYPIREKKVVSLASMIQSANIAPLVGEKSAARWRAVFPQKLQTLLDKG